MNGLVVTDAMAGLHAHQRMIAGLKHKVLLNIFETNLPFALKYNNYNPIIIPIL